MKDAPNDLILFAGSGNPALARLIAAQTRFPVSDSVVERFPDGETCVRLLRPVRGKQVFVIQPTSPPVNDHLIELACFADACRRASAEKVIAVIPYLGYARSDMRHGCRQGIGASMVATLLEAVGVQHVITLDLHSAQIEGFFHVPVDVLSALPVFCAALAREEFDDAVIVSPDAGRVRLATEYGHRLHLPVVVLHKRRNSPVETEVTEIVGDVCGKTCIIIDDMISTGGTIARAVEALVPAGARPDIFVAATHGPLLSCAYQNLNHPAIKRIFVTDSIVQPALDLPQLQILSIGPLLGAAVERIGTSRSVSDLFWNAGDEQDEKLEPQRNNERWSG